ncbi:MAG: response regulator [Treponema sp.]|nr:response regulator [Treponema sp.]
MDLLKVLIADDEANIRNGLKCILDWEKCGYKICGEASNGKDAVSQINDLRPDLVILDIKMPGLTGIEVMSQIKEYHEANNLEMPSIIILSGYSDFEYAQKSINKGAKAYLLKPVDEDELQEKVIAIANEIREKRALNEVSKNAEVFEINDYLLKLFENKKIKELGKLEENKFFTDYHESTYTCILINTEICSEQPINDLLKSLDNYYSFFTRIILQREKEVLVLLKASNEVAINNCIERTGRLNKNNMAFICKSNLYKGIEGILKGFEEVEKLNSYLFYISDCTWISCQSIKNQINEKENKKSLLDYIPDIVFTIETYDKTRLANIVEEIKTSYMDLNKSETETKKLFISCMIELRNTLISKYPEKEISNGTTFEVVPKILEAKSYLEIINYISSVFDELLENFNFNTSDSVIVKVIAYVKSNYASDLKLETLGDLFNCNSAYLGKKFKKYTGTQFNTYLDNLRIEDAKDKLLHTDLKIYQISKLVGYTNTDYFFMKFKKCTGYTPKEYKKVIENEK